MIFAKSAPLMSALFLLQSLPGSWEQVERITLAGALILAVIALWRSLEKKDSVLLDTTKTTTCALAEAAAANRELRTTIQNLIDTLNKSHEKKNAA